MLELEIVIEWTLIITIRWAVHLHFRRQSISFLFLPLSPFLNVSVVFNPLHDEAKVKNTHINAFK